MNKIFNTFIALLMFAVSPAFAGECDHLYPAKNEIKLKNTVELCNSFYVVRYDVQHQAAIATWEVIKANKDDVHRTNAFKADKRIEERYRVKPATYAKTKYDRGHLVPSEDANSQDQVHETFLMTNMTPQDPKLNRVSWKALEAKVRKMVAFSGKDTHVGTFAVYRNSQKIKGGTPIPVAYWKVVYLESGPRVFYAENKSTSKVVEVSKFDIQNATVPVW